MSGFLKFMTGVVIGGVAVALLTPTTGEDLRDKIKDVLKRKGLLPEKGVDAVVEMIAAELTDNEKGK